MTITTPSMGLQKPEVSITDGPAWATAINASLDTLDTHDHSTNSGVKITPAGLNINADLTLNTNYTTNAGGYQFSLSSTPTLDNVIYVNSNGDLQYKNTFGDFPIITSSGDIGGGFTGDYTTTTAEANYDDASKTYRFWQNTDLTANISTGSINIFENILAANPITLQSPASLASAYSLTLPTALAGGNNRAIISSSLGVLSYNDQELLTTSAATFATLDTGQGANELYVMNQNVQTTDAVTFASVDTGQGANELYAMDQNVRTTDSVTFANVSSTLNSIDYSALTQAEVNQIANIDTSTISITQWGYLGNTDQDITTTSAVSFATVNTGQGANELYAMNQDVQTTDSVTFANVSATLNSVDYSALTQAEINQIANIDLNTISAAQWGYVGNLNQDLTTTSNVTFNDLTTNGSFNPSTISTGALTCTTIDTGQGANEVYAMNQNVRTTDNVTFNDLTTTGTFSPGTISTGALTCTTIDTGQGANEVYAMDQNVQTSDSVTFDSATIGDSTGISQISMLAGGSSVNSASTSVTIPPADDTGAEPIYKIDIRQNDNTDITSRRLFRLANNGSSILDIDVNGQFRAQDGSVSNPAYSFSGDINTGIYTPALETLGFVTNGTERFRIGSSSFVPIATNSYNIGGISNTIARIFMGPGSVGAPSYTFGDDSSSGLYRAASATFAFSVNSSPIWVTTGSAFRPSITNTIDLGADSNRWDNIFGDRLLIASGSQSTPSIAFSDDTGDNTGLYRFSENQIGFTCNGGIRMRLTTGELVPGTGGVQNLGSGGTRWNNVFGVNGNFSGSLTKGSGSFRIDHPLDPTNKWLYHSFVESDEVLNIYRGNVKLNENGEKRVELPDWFNEVNENFSYQLTAIGEPANLYIKKKIKREGGKDRFVIAGGSPNLQVSWMVAAVRKDPYIIENPIEVEVEKTEDEKTLILHEEEYEKQGKLPDGYIKRKDRKEGNNN